MHAERRSSSSSSSSLSCQRSPPLPPRRFPQSKPNPPAAAAAGNAFSCTSSRFPTPIPSPPLLSSTAPKSHCRVFRFLIFFPPQIVSPLPSLAGQRIAIGSVDCEDRPGFVPATAVFCVGFIVERESSRMDGEAFRAGGHLGSSPAPFSSSAMQVPNQNSFLLDATSAPLQLQLFGNPTVPAVGPPGYCNYTGNNHCSVMNQARNTNIDAGDENQLKLQMSLNNYHQENAKRLPLAGNPSIVSTGLRLSYEDYERSSSITSGSGSMFSLPAKMSAVDDLMAEIDKDNKEISYYLRLQAEQFGKKMKEANQRQLISFLANVERAVGKKLKEKELEAEAMNKKSKELNEQIRQVTMEVQSWQSAALYNQSVANSLKSRLMQVVAQSTILTKEGSGDSEEDNISSGQNLNVAPGGFFQSSVLGSKSTTIGLGACRWCGGREASVLVMPCRHLCLCADCETISDVCPVCRFPKSGSVEINIS